MESFQVQTPDGISWYCERRGSGPVVVLVPSGEGDCGVYDKVATILGSSFTVLTFDMPGFSRTTAPSSAHQNVTMQLLADQVAGLMKELSISSATFYGSSSGGTAVLGLVARHPTLVQSAFVHEVPYHAFGDLAALANLPEGELVKICQDVFANQMNEDQTAWEALGPEYHSRLEKNYVTWIGGYVSSLVSSVRSLSDEDLTRKPIHWTIGALMPAGAFYENVQVTTRLGIDFDVFPCKHFPQVSIPEQLATHIQTKASAHI